MSFEEAVAYLSDPDTHGAGTKVDIVRTHAAIVFLAGDAAYKVKRPVRYDYLDFSTLEKRQAMLRRELELNRPNAPGIYLGLVPVTRQADGTLKLGEGGEVVEWCLHMRRFPAGAELVAVAGRDGISPALAEQIGCEIADYHARAEIRHADGRTLVTEIADELNEAFAGMTDLFGAGLVDRFQTRVRTAIEANAALLTDRGRAGHVRRGHGDLHLGNMVVLDGRPVLFDALEFDERLGTLDVLYDLGFVIMDLLHRGLSEAANAVLGAYLYRARQPEHFDGLALLPLFLGCGPGSGRWSAFRRRGWMTARASRSSRARGPTLIMRWTTSCHPRRVLWRSADIPAPARPHCRESWPLTSNPRPARSTCAAIWCARRCSGSTRCRAFLKAPSRRQPESAFTPGCLIRPGAFCRQDIR